MEKILRKWIKNFFRNKGFGVKRLANKSSNLLKKCYGCDTYFKPFQSKKWCSKFCYEKNRKIKRKRNKKPINCIQCQKEFIPKTVNAKTCSPKCKGDRRRDYFKIKYERQKEIRRSKKKVIKNCEFCKKEFVLNHPNRKFCSKNCRYESRQILVKKLLEKYSPKLREINDYDISSSQFPNEIKAYKNSGKKIIVFPNQISPPIPDVQIDGEDNSLEDEIDNFKRERK